MRRPAAILLVLLVGPTGCDAGMPLPGQEGTDSEAAEEEAAEVSEEVAEDVPEPLPEDFQGTAGIVDVERPAARISILRDVRVAEHAGFDRVVFELAGPDAPGYHVEYIDRPVRQCGSGDVVELAGDGWLEVRMSPVHAHTEEGRPTVLERERHPRLPVLLELELTCDFEAVVTWVLGMASPNRYRVVELADPPRLVIDIGH